MAKLTKEVIEKFSAPYFAFDEKGNFVLGDKTFTLVEKQMLKENRPYILIGPGRWGSSDPWLGIPVLWSEISEARMIVESAIPGYQIEPSQGTHFFQNITSLGVGYLTIDTVNKDGIIDEDLISTFKCVHDGPFVKLYEAPESMVGYIDRSSNKAILGY